MNIGGIQKLSMVDYPGHLCCTIFLQGCNLRCGFCHNPSLLEGCHGSQSISAEEVMRFLEKRKGYLDAVCISGGEPTLNSGLEDFIVKIKEMNYKVKLDTNGTRPEVIKQLLEKGLLDYIAVDIKAPEKKYALVTGCKVDFDKIKESISIVMNSEVEYEFRTTFMPELDREDIKEIAKSINGSKRYIVQQFRNDNTLAEKCREMKPHDEEYICEVLKEVESMFEYCSVRGIQ